MPFLEKRRLKSGKDSWRIVWYHPPTVRHTLKVGSVPKRIADQQLARVEVLLAEGKDPSTAMLDSRRRSRDVSALLEAFLEWGRTRFQPRNLQVYAYVVGRFIRWKGDVPASLVTSDLIEKYLAHLSADGLAATSINIQLRTLKALFNWASEQHFLDRHPFAKLRPFAVGAAGRRQTFLSVHQIELLFAVLQDDPNLLHLVQFYLWTGARRNEALDLCWRDVDFMRGVVWLGSVQSQTKLRRSVPITGRLRELLVGLWENGNKGPDDKVFSFWGSARGESVSRKFALLRRREPGLPKDFSVHVLRHTFASHLVMSGVDLTTVASFLGHSTTRTTEIYSHLLPDHRAAAIAALPY